MNRAAEALEQYLDRPRVRWSMIVVAAGSAYFLIHVALWAVVGFRVVG